MTSRLVELVPGLRSVHDVFAQSVGVALGLASLLWILVSAAGAAPQPLPSMPGMDLLAGDGTHHVLRIGPIPATQLDALRLEGLDGGSTVLAVHTLEDDDRETARQRPPVLGTWRLEAPDLVFEPRFPWVRGQTYLVRWRPPTASPDQAVHEDVLSLASSREVSPVTVVQEIFPSTTAVPQNLLKIYLQFSAPMTRGVARHHLRLWREADAEGRGEGEGRGDEPIASPFVAPEHELWNPAGDRLTLLFDPGRLKRGVGPNATVGPPLKAGQRVRLDVDATWPDASGRPLGRSARRSWQVEDSDRMVPRPQHWELAPPAHPEAPLTVRFDEPLDVALLQHALTVHVGDGDALDGDVVIDAQEQRWRFTPRMPWADLCGLRLHVHPVLEDLAGNRTFRRFDEPTPTPSEEATETSAETIRAETPQRFRPPRFKPSESPEVPIVLHVPCPGGPTS